MSPLIKLTPPAVISPGTWKKMTDTLSLPVCFFLSKVINSCEWQNQFLKPCRRRKVKPFALPRSCTIAPSVLGTSWLPLTFKNHCEDLIRDLPTSDLICCNMPKKLPPAPCDTIFSPGKGRQSFPGTIPLIPGAGTSAVTTGNIQH